MGRTATRARSDPHRRLARPRHGCFYFEVFPLFIHLQPFFQAIIQELSGGWLAGTCEANRIYIYIYICGYTYTRTCRHVKYITHICRPIYTYIHIYIYIHLFRLTLFYSRDGSRRSSRCTTTYAAISILNLSDRR